MAAHLRLPPWGKAWIARRGCGGSKPPPYGMHKNAYQSVGIGVSATHSFRGTVHALYRISRIITAANSRVQSKNGSEKYTDADARSLSA